MASAIAGIGDGDVEAGINTPVSTYHYDMHARPAL